MEASAPAGQCGGTCLTCSTAKVSVWGSPLVVFEMAERVTQVFREFQHRRLMENVQKVYVSFVKSVAMYV